MGRVAPFDDDLTGTVRSTAGPLAGHALTGVEGVAGSLTPGYAHHVMNAQDVRDVQNMQYGTPYSI